MATPRRKPTRSTTGAKKAAPKKKVVVKPTKAKSVPGSKGGFTALMREAENKGKPQTAVKQADPNSFASIIKAMRAIYGDKRVHILEVPYMERGVAQAMGAEYVERIKKYVSAGDLLPLPLHPYKSEDFSYNRWMEDQINGRIQTPEKPKGGYFTPRPHQQEAIDAIKRAAAAGWRGFIEADATGLGKTISGLVGASEAASIKGFTRQKKAKMLIISPNRALPHWRNTIRHLQLDNLRIQVINYEQYKKLLTVPSSAATVKKAKTKNKHITESGKPFIQWDFIIADESHKIKNYTSQRTKVFERVARYAETADKAPFIIWQSATLGQNPLELAYLAPLFSQVAKRSLTMETFPAWLQEVGFHVQKKGDTWQWVKPANPQDAIPREQQRQDVQRLAEILFAPKAPSIRRKPEDIAGWPEVNKIALPIQLDPDSAQQYNKLWTEFRKSMHLKVKGKNPKSVLAEQLRFAQKASLLRVPQTVDNIVDLLENGYQVAVSVRFIETLEAIKGSLKKLGLDASEFSGRDFINTEHERMLFQKGDNKVILFTVEEAVSFHAKEQLPDGTIASPFPRALLIHDMRYSALSMTQIVGRTHRDGQAANAYFMYSEGTVEEAMLNIMLNKMQNMSVLSGDEEEDTLMELLENLPE